MRQFWSSRAVRCVALASFSIGILASCGEPGPLQLSLDLSQAQSGDNRSIAATVDGAKEAMYSAVEYKAMNDLSVDRISGFAWSVVARPKAKDAFRELASAFGVTGDVKKNEKNSYTIGLDADKGTGMWLWVDVAGAWWSYAGGMNSAAVSSPCAPDDTVCGGSPVVLPKNLLSAREALNRTATLMTRGGYNPATFQMSAQSTDWSTDVTGVFSVAGIPTNLSVHFSYGADGALVSASGPFLYVDRANGYYLVSPNDAVQRLSDSRYTAWGPATRSAIDIAVSSVGAPATDSSLASDSGVMPRTVVPITGVRYVLMQAALTNNASILVPAYTYFNNEGDVGTVIAMKDEDLKFNEPSIAINTVVPPQPVDPGTGVSPGDSGGGSPGDGGAIEPGILPTTLTEESAKSLIGLTENEAVKVAAERGWTVRVAMRDGEAFMLTKDYLANRVNLTVMKTLVTAVTIG
jgi:hypothetical protein